MARRTKLGLLALLLIILAGVIKLFESSSPMMTEAWGACLKFGLILGAFWLAFPDLARLPVWLIPAIVLIALAAIRWKIFLFLIPPAIFLGWLLRPRNKHPAR